MKIRETLNRLFMKKEIGNGLGDVFFYRYRLLETRWFGVYIHRFVRGDMDRCLHDHPWSFLAIVLRGGYFEEMFTRPWIHALEDGETKKRAMGFENRLLHGPSITAHWRRPGSILWRPAKTAHRITLDESKPKPVSLVFVGRKVRPWGFHTLNGWVAWVKGQGNPICETK